MTQTGGMQERRSLAERFARWGSVFFDRRVLIILLLGCTSGQEWEISLG